MNLCLCGCRREAKNKFIHGHNRVGKTHTKESKEKMRLAQLGKKQPKETIEKRVRSRAGYNHSEETKQKMREVRLNNPICYWTGKEMPKEIKEKISLAQKGVKETPEAIAKTHAWHKDPIKRQRANEKLRTSHIGKTLPQEQKEKISKASKLNWLNKAYREKVIKNSLKSLRRRPTSLEKQFIEICQEHKLPYKYVGDGSFLIGWKNPDFINLDGEKICIEVRAKDLCMPFEKIPPDEYEKRRIEHFKKFGWKCLVFFDNNRKLDENEIMVKLDGNLS